MEFVLRPAQERILGYTHGTMGISAVPGSGKTFTLSALAARLIQDGQIGEHQEILIVTLTNSAVDNFSTRINAFLTGKAQRRLIPPFRVRTLHGLAHDIVRDRPDLVGLDSTFQIIDDREGELIRNEAAVAWLRGHPNALDGYLKPDLEGPRIASLHRDPLPRLVQSIALAFIRTAKDKQLNSDELQAHLARISVPLPLIEMGTAIYADYQRALAYRGAVDFDDLIRLALQALQTDQDFLDRLRGYWPYILEDEAQDSSHLQEQILRALVGEQGNWVRVGDPNQAIFESFTTADPKYLREFITGCDFPIDLPNSGRSTQSVIDLANYLIDWTQNKHPTPAVRDALHPPHIAPTEPDDPQPNPTDQPDQIFLISNKYRAEDELEAVVKSIARWLPENPDKSIAVLVPRNDRGFKLRDELAAVDIPTHDGLLKASSSTRRTAGALANILRYLGDPKSPRKLGKVFQVWQRDNQSDPELWREVEETSRLITQIPNIEDYIWPGIGGDWLAEQEPELDHERCEQLVAFRDQVRIWQGAVLLPVDQIVLTLAQDLFHEPTELALAHKLAVLLRQAENTHQEWRLPELSGELAVIAKNERRFLGFSEDDTGFDPDSHRGVVVISTVHKAKGLEWDRVYLMSANNYNYPSGESYDQYISERWFIRDSINLEAETLGQLEALTSSAPLDWPDEGGASIAARHEYIRERLRLLYVGITRAREELIVTWNTGRFDKSVQARSFEALSLYWENTNLD